MKKTKTSLEEAQEIADQRQRFRVQSFQQVLSEMSMEHMKQPDRSTFSLQMSQSVITVEVIWWDEKLGLQRRAHSYSREHIEDWSMTNLLRSLNKDIVVSAGYVRSDSVMDFFQALISDQARKTAEYHKTPTVIETGGSE